jgi:hypothetical protein
MNSKLSANNCTFSNCKEYGIRKEIEYLTNSNGQVGDIEILQNLPDILLQNCKFENNVKGNVTLKPSSNIAIPMKTESNDFKLSQA